MKFWYNRMINKVNSFYNHGAIFKLWESRIKVIEGEFGTGVGTYFRFLRTYFFQGLFVGILGYAVNDLLGIPHLHLKIVKLTFVLDRSSFYFLFGIVSV